jgi:Lipoprotein LpqB beta-propeller domain/Sporulation and spore germination
VASRGIRRPVLAGLGTLAAALSAAGCVSMPSGGPVVSYSVTQGAESQDQPFVQIVPKPPGAGWTPSQIVQGFLTASASFGNNSAVAYEYLTPQERKSWKPQWSAIVYKVGPNVAGRDAPVAGAKNTVTVQISGKEQASLQGNGSYSVPTASGAGASSDADRAFTLVKQADGQWRISDAPSDLLLTSDSFNSDYQLRNLYFFDPAGKALVPDPVYVPVRTSSPVLLNGLVSDLISPPKDWLSGGATKTALPAGTKISSVNLDGVTAVVNLTGTIAKANNKTMVDVSAQLLWTLRPAQSQATAQAVQSVEVEVNGKPWIPPGSQGNPVQHQSTIGPPTGYSPVFYYVDSAGYLTSSNGGRAKPVRLMRIGTGFSQIAVSPDTKYLAALRGATVYTGPIGGVGDGALTKRTGSYVSISWDRSDDLWATTGTQIVMFRGGGTAGRPPAQPVPVSVNVPGYKGLNFPFGDLRVAPDGVRAAIVYSSNVLAFGAISGQQSASPQIELSQVTLPPLNADEFTGVSWYGPDDVITLADPGPVATEYAVSGGSTTSIPVDSDMQSITASSKNLLIASLPNNRLATDVSVNGSWTPLPGSGTAPAYPG